MLHIMITITFMIGDTSRSISEHILLMQIYYIYVDTQFVAEPKVNSVLITNPTYQVTYNSKI